jgi:hypothetical protein
VTSFKPVPWNKLYASLFFGTDVTSCETNLHVVDAGQGTRKTDVDAYLKFTRAFEVFSRAHPFVNGSFVAQRFSSKGPLSLPANSTAYPYRDIKTHL